MTGRPRNCAACGKPTTSHNVALDVSGRDELNAPTVAGVCCHTCWEGGTDGVGPIGHAVAGAKHDDWKEEQLVSALLMEFDLSRMVLTAVPVSEL